MKWTPESIAAVKRAASMTAVARLFCKGVKPDSKGNHASAVCCFHDDSNPSLDIDEGKGVYLCRACHAGGDAITMIERMRGVSFNDAIVELSTITGVPLEEAEKVEVLPRIVAEWTYHDDAGETAYTIKRWEPGRGRDGKSNGKRKSYSQHLADGKPGKALVQLPYHLPQLITARTGGAFVVVTEGEKAADAVTALGVTATTWAGGTSTATPGDLCTWTPAFAEHFRGARVALWPDNDDVGRAAMLAIANALKGVAAEVLTIADGQNLKGADAANWVDGGGTREGLQALIVEARTRKVAAIADEAPPTAHGEQDPLTDSGNAERWVRMCGRDFRYLVEDETWLHWDGKVWRRGAEAAAMHSTKAVARSWAVDMAKETDGKKRIEIRQHKDNSESSSKRVAMLKLAAYEPGVAVTAAELDRNPMIVNARNGIVNLLDGKLQKHDRDELCTKMIDVDFHADAKCPTFDAFLAQVLPKRETAWYLMKLFGYALTGVVREHLFPVLWGQTGRNGKGTLVETLFAITGAYSTSLPNEVIIEAKNDPHPNMFAQLVGLRCGVCAELKATDKLNEAMLKRLTGGDQMRARFMGGEFFSFPSTWKIFLQTNYKPRVRGGDPALWARMAVIPFGQSFAGREDLGLKGKLLAEREGIFALLVRACLAWQAEGLAMPDEVREATADYREDSDRVGAFLLSQTTRAVAGVVPSGLLWKKFREWCDARGEQPGAQNVFGAEVRAHGIQTTRVAGERRYSGITLRTNGTADMCPSERSLTEEDDAPDPWGRESH
jgi:putative DNA primase/helicase